jgi:SET domain-containing protein
VDRDLPPPDEVWTHSAVHVDESSIAGRGLFADSHLDAGTVVIRLGGRLVSTDELRRLFAEAASSNEYIDTFAVGDDCHIVLPQHTAAHFGNHSCDPTMWPVSAFELAARHDVEAGEELTVDYGLISDDAEFQMICACGTTQCRGLVTGQDWRRADLRERYRSHWPPGLQRRIAILEQTI